jgi:NhaP-type Na+/H+ or K+/H+ antiporter
MLFSLVFGEGVVNDATSVVLLGALERSAGRGGGAATHQSARAFIAAFIYLLLTSCALGACAGLGIAALLKHRLGSSLQPFQVGCWAGFRV